MTKNDTPPYVLGHKAYETIKWTTQIVLPATGSLYFGLSQTWGFPNGEEAVGTITLVVTFLGVILGLSNHGYKRSDARFDGDIDITETEDATKYSLNLNEPPENLSTRSEVTFKITPK